MTMSSTTVVLTGNLIEDPELRFTPTGAAVCNFAVACSDRKFNKDSNEWEDGPTTFFRGSVWRRQAENVAESCRKGDRVVITGRLQQREYEDREGQKRTVMEVQADEVARSLLFNPVLHSGPGGSKVTREGASQSPSANDPWATPGYGDNDEPPF